MRTLDAYFERIGHRGPVRPDLATLQALHYRHPLAIPFENLSTLTGAPVPIDVPSIESKLIAQGRGGYCFEHNTLFQSVLERIGLRVTPLAARVVWSADSGHVNPRTHMVLLVAADGAEWLVDVGFGGATLTAPLRFVPDVEQATPHETFRIVRDQSEFELQVLWAGSWRRMYRFDLQPQLPIDFEALNHYVATHPRSHFRTVLLAARALPDLRLALQNFRLLRLRAGEPLATEDIGSVAALLHVLNEEFGIETAQVPDLERRLTELDNGSTRTD